MKKIILALIFVLICTTSALAGQGNQVFKSFNKAKKTLERKVYFDHRKTIYCGASFDDKKHVLPLNGFVSPKYKERAKKVEWEHIVPAENFGRTFAEWREGNPECVNKRGKAFKGRKCAEKINHEYRLMQSDLYNLAPAIGSVNALRQNYNFTVLPSAQSDFGSCQMKIENRKAEPPEMARGRIARTYKYMDKAYPHYKMSKAQRQLMDAWDKMYPVSRWECTRAKRIENLQGNTNPFVVCE